MKGESIGDKEVELFFGALERESGRKGIGDFYKLKKIINDPFLLNYHRKASQWFVFKNKTRKSFAK